MSITDILQMLGRAGRPQFDNTGVACVYVQESKRNFYKKFLHSPFPVESSLHKFLPDHLNAEIVAGTVKSKQNVMDYLSWTFFYRRLQMNPTYYGLEDPKHGLQAYLSKLIDASLHALQQSFCIDVVDDGQALIATEYGRLASFYYLLHNTVRHMHKELGKVKTFEDMLRLLSDASEYDEHPVRHNEDLVNAEFKQFLPFAPHKPLDDPHTKVFLLLQSHVTRTPVPVPDYHTDIRSALDQAARITQAMVDASAILQALDTTLLAMECVQCIKTATGPSDDPWQQFNPSDSVLQFIANRSQIQCIADLALSPSMLSKVNDADFIKKLQGVLIPTISFSNQQTCRPGADVALDLKLTYPHTKQSTGDMEQGWWVLIGSTLLNQVMALKRISQDTRRTTVKLQAPIVYGEYAYTLYLISDTYKGIDQEYPLMFSVSE
jgi:hypothetical protein